MTTPRLLLFPLSNPPTLLPLPPSSSSYHPPSAHVPPRVNASDRVLPLPPPTKPFLITIPPILVDIPFLNISVFLNRFVSPRILFFYFFPSRLIFYDRIFRIRCKLFYIWLIVFFFFFFIMSMKKQKKKNFFKFILSFLSVSRPRLFY